MRGAVSRLASRSSPMVDACKGWRRSAANVASLSEGREKSGKVDWIAVQMSCALSRTLASTSKNSAPRVRWVVTAFSLGQSPRGSHHPTSRLQRFQDSPLLTNPRQSKFAQLPLPGSYVVRGNASYAVRCLLAKQAIAGQGRVCTATRPSASRCT